MIERPILFSEPMVLALMMGEKNQTRRVVKPQLEKMTATGGVLLGWTGDHWHGYKNPYGWPGDRLWVRERWRCEELPENGLDGVRYAADDIFIQIENSREASEQWLEAYRRGGKWRPSIHMPRWASRITLKVVKVRVERVQDISEADAASEGCRALHIIFKNGPSCRDTFMDLWKSINEKRGFGWEANPWVWVIEFKTELKQLED